MSKVTKFLLDTGASENTELTCSHYNLVRGELQTSCKISIETHSSFNKAVFENYENVVKEHYIEPMEKTVTIKLARENYTEKFAKKLL